MDFGLIALIERGVVALEKIAAASEVLTEFSLERRPPFAPRPLELRHDWPMRDVSGKCPDCGVGPEGWRTDCRACVARRLMRVA